MHVCIWICPKIGYSKNRWSRNVALNPPFVGYIPFSATQAVSSSPSDPVSEPTEVEATVDGAGDMGKLTMATGTKTWHWMPWMPTGIAPCTGPIVPIVPIGPMGMAMVAIGAGMICIMAGGVAVVGSQKAGHDTRVDLGAHGGPQEKRKKGHHFNTQNSFVWGILRQVSSAPRLRVPLHQGNREIEILLCNVSKCWAS